MQTRKFSKRRELLIACARPSREQNICVGAANVGIPVDDNYAALRLIAADVLSAGGDVEGMDRLQAAHRRCFFYLRTAGEFSSLGRHEVAEACLRCASLWAASCFVRQDLRPGGPELLLNP